MKQSLPKRVMGKSGVEVFPLGFGCMRLPRTEDGKTDQERSVRMLCDAVDQGITYFDTAFGYLGGRSESIVGKALKNLKRDDITLATKLPIWHECSREYADRTLATQLERLGTDHIDFYLLHGQSKDVFAKAREEGILEWLDEQVKAGKIRYPSFSFHDDHATFVNIIDSYDWYMAQVQMNYLDINNQATMEGVAYAGKKGVTLIAMEPLLGGALANNVPEEVTAAIDAFPVKRSPVEWAFRFLLDRPEFSVLLSGMSTEEQVAQNLETFSKPSQPGCMSAEEHALIDQLRTIYENRKRIGCTNCRYCMPCPSGVRIPDIFERLNEGYRFNDIPGPLSWFHEELKKENQDASQCTACGACEGVCPQKLPIIETLKEVVRMLA